MEPTDPFKGRSSIAWLPIAAILIGGIGLAIAAVGFIEQQRLSANKEILEQTVQLLEKRIEEFQTGTRLEIEQLNSVVEDSATYLESTVATIEATQLDESVSLRELESEIAKLKALTLATNNETSPPNGEQVSTQIIPLHAQNKYYIQVAAIREVASPELLDQARALDAQARSKHADAERKKKRATYDTYQALKREAHDLEREARRRRALHAKPDFIVVGNDADERRVSIRFDNRWESRISKLSPGEIICFRGIVEKQDTNTLSINNASLLPM